MLARAHGAFYFLGELKYHGRSYLELARVACTHGMCAGRETVSQLLFMAL